MSADSQVYEHLHEIAEALTTLKGKQYSRLVMSIFSVGNVFETLVDRLPASDEEKTMFGAMFSMILSQLGASTVDYIAKADGRDPKTVAEELGKDLTMLQKKQQEFNT